MKYKKSDGSIVELNYILKIYFDTPLYYAVEPQSFSDPDDSTPVNIPIGLMSLPSSTTKEINVKECTLSNDSINIELLNKDLEQTTMLYNSINSEIDNIYKKEASLYISLDGILTKEFSGFITGFPTIDIWETKISITIDNTREILSSSLFEDQLSSNNAIKSNLNDAFNVEVRNKDRGLVYNVNTINDMLNLSNISEKDTCFVVNENKYYKNDTGFNESIEDWKKKKEVDIQKIIVFGNNPNKNKLTDLALALFSQSFNNDTTILNKYVDTDSFDFNNYDITKSFPVYFEWYEKIDNTFDFVQEEIFKYLNAYPIIDNNGKLKLIKQKQPDVSEGVSIINEYNIIDVVSNENDFSNLINNVSIKNDYSFRDEDFKSEPKNYQGETVNKYGKSPKKPYEYEVKFDANMSLIEKNSFYQTMANYLFERYSDRLKVLSFDLFFSLNVINEGDYIKLDHDLLIDWEEGDNTGLRGINLTAESFDMLINNKEQWGNYIGNYYDNLIGFLNGYKVIKVDRNVNTTFFNNDKSISYNHWRTKYKIPCKYHATKGIGVDQGEYGELKCRQY